MNFFNNKSVLVTGGTGFVGSHLVEKLVLSGARVITTFQALEAKSYFMTKQLADKTTIAPVDIVDFEGMFDLVTKYEVEMIFHLAAQPLIGVAYHNPRRTLDSNIRGTINILECARLYPKVKRIVFASSDKAYGHLKKNKYEETDRLHGVHPYEVSKSAADLIANSYYKTYGVPVITTRFGNIYGEGDLNFSRIIPGIMKALLHDETLLIRSDGTFVRDYLYVKDVVDGYLQLAETSEKVIGQAFNFGSPDSLSVIDAIGIVEKALGKTVKYKILNTAKNEIPYQSLNYDKIKKLLKWKPKHSVKTTAQQIYQWYSSY